MNLIRNMLLKNILSKLLPHLPGDNELKQNLNGVPIFSMHYATMWAWIEYLNKGEITNLATKCLYDNFTLSVFARPFDWLKCGSSLSSFCMTVSSNASLSGRTNNTFPRKLIVSLGKEKSNISKISSHERRRPHVFCILRVRGSKGSLWLYMFYSSFLTKYIKYTIQMIDSKWPKGPCAINQLHFKGHHLCIHAKFKIRFRGHRTTPSQVFKTHSFPCFT